jgi:hypothetical protein
LDKIKKNKNYSSLNISLKLPSRQEIFGTRKFWEIWKLLKKQVILKQEGIAESV